VFGMRIQHKISKLKGNASSTYSEAITNSKKVLDNLFAENNRQQILYVLSVAELRAKGKDLSVVKLKKLFKAARLNGEVILKRMRLVNFYLNSLRPEEAEKFIKKLGNPEGRNINATSQTSSQER